MVGSIQEMTRTGCQSMSRLMMNPLKKTLASRMIMLYCTAWLSVCEMIEMAKPIPSEVNSTAAMTPAVERACATDKPVIVFDRGVNTDCQVTFIHPIGGFAWGIDTAEGSMPREPGDKTAASYINFLICNGGIVMPVFDDPNDAVAKAKLEELFPGREVVTVPGREIVLGGGNVHCITQQQPRG